MINNSLNMFINNVFPSLFPIFIFSELLINYDFNYYISRPINNIMEKIFKINYSLSSVLFLSMISGFPNNARNVRLMYDKKMINERDASKILIWSHFSNPLFILGSVGTIFLKNKNLGIIILVSHYLGNFILGFIFRNYNSDDNRKEVNVYNINEEKNFPKIFLKAISNSVNTLLLISGTITIFFSISTILSRSLNLNIYNETLLRGILEVTQGIELLSRLNISEVYKVVISTMFLSFGGLSVHLQVLSFINDTKISYKMFFIGRILHTIISGVISYLLYNIII